MEKIYQKGMKLESNTYYKAGAPHYDIYPEDCVCTNDNMYFSYTKAEVKDMPVAFFLKDLENITLDFGGATIVLHGKITPYIIDNCKNVKLKNFKLDYDRPFYTQAHVLECDSKHMKVRIDDGFRYRVENGYLYAVSDTWEKNLNFNDCLLWLFDRTGQREYPIILSLFGPEIFPWENPPLPIGQILVEEDGDCLIFKGNFPESWDVNNGNNSLVFTHEARDKCSVIAVNSENIYFEDFIIIHGAAYAVMGMNCKNMYFDNFSMYMNYEGNGRLVTNNADGIHFFNCKGEFVLKNSYMEGLLDDTVNIHNNYLNIVGIDGDKLFCRFVGKSVTLECPVFAEGDKIAVYRGRTQEKKGEYTIKNVHLDFENNQFVFTLDREIDGGIVANDIIENLSGHPNILIENCEFGRFRGTMRLQSRDKTVVRNCKFNNKSESIIFTGDTTYWYESGPVNDFLIDGCSFPCTHCGARIRFFGEVEYTEAEKYYHRNVTVRNCYFDQGWVATLNHVDNFVFENNTSNGKMMISANACGELKIDEDVHLHRT